MLQSIINKIDLSGIKEHCGRFNATNNWYDQVMIANSLYDLVGESLCTDDKPAIIFHCGSTLINELEDILKFCSNRNVIYIAHINGNHYVTFYLSQKQRKILLIDPLCTSKNVGNLGIEPFLESKDYTLYASTTQIQHDGYSCGPIASEVARMLYSNHKAVEDYLSQEKRSNLVDLNSFLPKKKLDQLCSSFAKKGTINYGRGSKSLYGADYRAAHFACRLILRDEFFVTARALADACKTVMVKQVKNKFQQEKQRIEGIRPFFIGNPKNVDLLNEKIKKLLQPESLGNKDKPQYKSLFFMAAALSTLIIALALITQNYIVLAALLMPTVFAIYTWHLCKEDKQPKSSCKLKDTQEFHVSGAALGGC